MGAEELSPFVLVVGGDIKEVMRCTTIFQIN